MNVAKYVLTVVLSATCGVALAAKPIQNLIDIPVPEKIDGSSPSTEDVRSAIVAGCKERTWVPIPDEDNNISCSILVRSRHFAEVEIPYTGDTYSIIYKDSRELDYNGKKQRIHRNYNKWVLNLSDSIQRRLANAD